MFLIAKIVRGRRLLHELEQAEKEKEKERERDRLEAQRKSIREDSTASTGSSSNSKNEKITGFTHHRRTGTSKEDSDAKKKSVMLVENNENKASTSGENDKEPKLRRRKWYQHSFTHLAHQKAPHRRMIHSFPASVSTVSLRKGVSLDDDFYNRTVKANGAKRGSYDTRIKTSEGYGREVAYGISKGGTYSSTKGGEYGTTKSSLYDTTKRTSYCATKALPYCTNTVSYTKRKSYDTSKSLYDTKPSLYSNPKHSSTEMLPMLQRARQQSSRWSLSMEEAWIKLSRRLTSPCTLPLAMDLSSVCISRSFKKNKPKKRVRREYYLKNVMYNSKALRQKTDTSLVTDSNHELAQRMRRTSSMPSVVDAMHKTSLERIRHYNYDLKLSKLQKRALRFTWHRLQTRNGGKRVDLVFEDVYDRLMRVVPIMKEMFTTRAFLSAMSKHEVATPRDHARFTVKMIDAVIKNLDTDDKKRTDTRSEYDPVLIGRAHAVLRPYGFVASIWEKLGETIIDVVLVQDAVRDLPGAGQAWVVLTACLVDQLRAGFEQNRDPKNRIPGRCPMHEMNKHSTVHPPHQVHPPHPFQTFSTPQTQRSASPILDLDQATEQLRQNSINRDRHSPPSEPVQRRAFSHQQSLPYPYMDEDVDENVESGNSLVLNRNEQMMLREQQKEDIRVAEALISGRYLDKQNELSVPS